MAAQEIQRDNLELGRQVLLVTDLLGMSVEGAFWYYNSDDGEWDYFLVTSLLARIGPKRIFEKLEDILRKVISEEEIHDFRILIADPQEPFVKAVKSAADTQPLASRPQKVRIKMNGHTGPAYIYRMSKNLSDTQAKSAERRLGRRYSELVSV